MQGNSEVEIKLLLHQLRSGNQRAFEQLYRMYSRYLLSNIRMLVKDKEIADEILQDAFLKIWECREAVDPEKSFKNYLFTITRNLVYDHLRKVALDVRKRCDLMQKALEIYTHVEEELINKENDALLSDAVDHLPFQCRKVYTLSKLDGKSHQEISELLNISLATVNNHMVKANRQIRSFLLRNGELSLVIALMLCNYIRK
ncbi:RNA polymerase sigma-70 factor [Mucilaginibacter sp. cycad4]|uniref:RNA polymerase sigma factor n=1 Tax=Mucilaginibacter sp. cycad4 TaxID=3342096 RepID=UPI002AAAF7F6|nr:RNA polymerase sigma-70 factor [Mucilaginibacter gossypii]WPU98428.1 RNA polymerase sigma-70 factor [Mucilaginibacter gossypii]